MYNICAKFYSINNRTSHDEREGATLSFTLPMPKQRDIQNKPASEPLKVGLSFLTTHQFLGFLMFRQARPTISLKQ